MKLRDISDIHSGYIARGKIESLAAGSHYLVQAKNVSCDHLTCDTAGLIRFNPNLSRNDQLLEKDDLLFMARGAHNSTIRLGRIPKPALAAACFFVVRISSPVVLPGYLSWYLNQAPVKHYLFQNSGRSVHMPVVRRAVLESTQIPLPPVELQLQIADMNALMFKEMNLLQQLGKKRRELITAACLQTVSDY